MLSVHPKAKEEHILKTSLLDKQLRTPQITGWETKAVVFKTLMPA